MPTISHSESILFTYFGHSLSDHTGIHSPVLGTDNHAFIYTAHFQTYIISIQGENYNKGSLSTMVQQAQNIKQKHTDKLKSLKQELDRRILGKVITVHRVGFSECN